MDDSKIGQSTTVLVSDKVEGRKLMQYVAALCATLGGLSLGTSLGWTSPASDPKVLKYDFPIKEDAAWIGAMLPLGAAAFAFPIGILINQFGRKMSMLALVVPFTVGWALIIWANGVEMIMAGRFILGIAGGSFAVAAPTYTSEIAEKSIRGALGSYFQLLLTLGCLLVYLLGIKDISLFAISLTCGVIPLIFGVVFFFMPDTPTWYISKGRTEDARRSLKFFRGDDYANLEVELNEIIEDVEKVRREKVSLREAFMSRAPKYALVIALGLMCIQQLSGVNVVIFYTSDIFIKAGSDIEPSICSVIVGVVQFVMCFVSTLIVDRLGRKILLLLSAGIMCICTLLLGVYFYLNDNNDPAAKSISWLPLVSTCLFIAMFSLGFGPIPWMIVGELFLPQTKGIAASIASCLNWLLVFVVTKFFEDLVHAIHTGPTFWIFTGLLAIGTLFVWFVVKETKGKSFEQIQRELGDS